MLLMGWGTSYAIALARTAEDEATLARWVWNYSRLELSRLGNSPPSFSINLEVNNHS
jgi:hypothetical protein